MDKKSSKVHLTFKNDRRGYYVPSDFQRFGEEDLQKLKNEYTRLRDIARKRIDRLEKSGLLYESDITRFRNMIPKISELKNPNVDIRMALSDVSRLLNKEYSTIPKARKEAEQRKKQYEEFIEKVFKYEPNQRTENFDFEEVNDKPRSAFDEYQTWNARMNNSSYIQEKVDFYKSQGLNEETWWEFVSFTKYMMNDNVYYWTKNEINALFDSSAVMDKLIHHDFFTVYSEIQKGFNNV